MKILWFTNTPCSASERLSIGLNRGGWLSSLEQELSKRNGTDLHVAFYYEKQVEPFQYKNTWFYPIFIKHRGSRTQRYFSRLLKKSDYDKKELLLLKEIVNQVNPDLIHVHGTENNFGLIQYYTTIPVVASLQGIINPYAEKFYSGIPANIASRYESLKKKVLLASSHYTFNTFKKNAVREYEILKDCNYIIGRTDWDRQVTKVLAPHSRYFIGQEMLRPSFYQKKWNKTNFNETIQIISLSSDSLYKGFETVVKTTELLLSIPDFKFEWLVIGVDKSSEIVKLTQKWLKISPEEINIRLLGEKIENEIVDILLNSDIYCQVSHIENSPNSLCEAMLLGLPIIASYAGGTSSILKNGEEGVLVQDGDPYVLAGAIIEMSTDFSSAQKLAKAAQKHASERHNKNKIVNNLIDTYYDILRK